MGSVGVEVEREGMGGDVRVGTGYRSGREGGGVELQGGVQHVAQRDHEEGVCEGGRLKGRGECRVSKRGAVYSRRVDS